MYPYQYQFVTDDPVRNQYEKDTFWFYDGLHYPEPLYPFDTIWDEAWFLALSQYNNRIFMVPPVRGVDHRMINGYVYISPVPVKDPAEIGAPRAPLHGARRLLLQELGRAGGQVEGEDGGHHHASSRRCRSRASRRWRTWRW